VKSVKAPPEPIRSREWMSDMPDMPNVRPKTAALEQRFVAAVRVADPLRRLSAEDRVIRVAAVRAAYYRREAQRRRIRFARNASRST